MPRRRGERGKIGNPGEIPVGSRAAGVACGVASSDNRGLRSRRRRRGRRRRCRCGDKCTCHAVAMSTGWRMKGRKKKKYSWTGARRRRRRGGGGWRTEPQPRERPRCVAQTSAHRAPLPRRTTARSRWPSTRCSLGACRGTLVPRVPLLPPPSSPPTLQRKRKKRGRGSPASDRSRIPTAFLRRIRPPGAARKLWGRRQGPARDETTVTAPGEGREFGGKSRCLGGPYSYYHY